MEKREVKKRKRESKTVEKINGIRRKVEIRERVQARHRTYKCPYATPNRTEHSCYSVTSPKTIL